MNRLPFLVIRNYSNLQLFQSTEIANTAYNTKGYNLPPKNARWLVIIMCRARSSPLQITAGRFCSFTFALYCQVSVNELLLCTIFSEMKMIFNWTAACLFMSYDAICGDDGLKKLHVTIVSRKILQV